MEVVSSDALYVFIGSVGLVLKVSKVDLYNLTLTNNCWNV